MLQTVIFGSHCFWSNQISVWLSWTTISTRGGYSLL